MKILFSLVLFFTVLSVKSQDTWSLEECIEKGISADYDLQYQLLENDKMSLEVKKVKSERYPNFTFDASQGYRLGSSYNVSTNVGQLESSFTNFSLNSSLIIFQGNASRYRREISDLALIKGNALRENVLLQLKTQITERYLRVLFCQEILRISKEQENVSCKETEQIKALVEKGIAGQKKLLETKSIANQDIKERILAEKNLNIAKIELKELLNLNENSEHFEIEEIVIDFEALDYNSEYNLDTIVAAHPDMELARIGITAASSELKLAKSAYYPKISMFYSYSSNYYHVLGEPDIVFNQITNQYESNGFFTQLNNNKTHYVGFSLSMPIFNGYQVKYNTEKLRIAYQQKRLELQKAERTIRSKLAIINNNISYIASNSSVIKDAVNMQEKQFEMAKENYRNGYIDTTGFLQYKIQYLNALSDMIIAKYDFILNYKLLELYKKAVRY